MQRATGDANTKSCLEGRNETPPPARARAHSHALAGLALAWAANGTAPRPDDSWKNRAAGCWRPGPPALPSLSEEHRCPDPLAGDRHRHRTAAPTWTAPTSSFCPKSCCSPLPARAALGSGFWLVSTRLLTHFPGHQGSTAGRSARSLPSLFPSFLPAFPARPGCLLRGAPLPYGATRLLPGCITWALIYLDRLGAVICLLAAPCKRLPARVGRDPACAQSQPFFGCPGWGRV